MNANVVSAGPNLDILAEIVDANSLAVIAQNNPDTSLNASVSANLVAGEYLFRVRGTGRGDPLGSGYTNYASLGSYIITGSASGIVKSDRFSIAENSPNGTQVGIVNPRNNHSGQAITYQISSGNLNNAFSIQASSGQITVANSSALDFETLSTRWDDPAEIALFVSITNAANPSLNESIRVVITVSDVNEAPILSAGNNLTLLPATQVGTNLLTLSSSDPDRFQYPTLSISSGNNAGFFSLDSGSGILRVASSPITPGSYSLVITSTDQGSPQRSSSSTVNITVIDVPDGFEPGSIVRTFYNDIIGTSVSSLTSSAKFPQNPDDEQTLSSFDGGSYGENYGSTIRGYVIAPATGTYRFWIASDDASQLLFNSAGYDPNGASVIASVSGWTSRYAWTDNASQASTSFNLTAGEAYYIEARHKEGGGDDHVAVAWTTPLDSNRQVIPGIYLAPYLPNYPPSITAASYTVRENAIAGQTIGTVVATDSNSDDTFSNFSIIAGNVGGVFGIESSTGRLFVARSGVLNRATIPAYTLTIRVRDSGQPSLTGTGTVTVNVTDANDVNSGTIVQQVWAGIGGNPISLLKNNPNFPYNPSYTRDLTSGFNSGTRIADSYGSRVRAYIVPPSTGPYQFYLCTDDEGELWFSTSDQADDATLIASITDESYASNLQWDKFPSQESATFNLVAGERYYIDALQKEGAGGDHLQVGWTGPGIRTPVVIPISALEPYNINAAPIFDPSSYSFAVDGSQPVGRVIGTVSASDPEGESIVYAIVDGDPSGSFAIDSTGRITLADPSSLANGNMTLTVAAQDAGLAGSYPYMTGTANVSITVTGASNQLDPPVASPDSGNYVGPLVVTLTASSGSSIRYTLDGSDPRVSSSRQSALSPVNVTIPAPGATKLRAYATQIGVVDSPLIEKDYQCVTADAITWINRDGGTWATSSNWLYGVVANGADQIALFDTLTLGANREVSLDGSRSVGGIRFGDLSGQYSWTISAGDNGSLALAATGAPIIHVPSSQTATISAPILGSDGLEKTGDGTLVLSGNNTYSPGTELLAGTIIARNADAFGSGTIQLGGGVDDVSLILGSRADILNSVVVSSDGSGSVTLGADNSGSGLDPASYLGNLTFNRPVTIQSGVTEDRLALDGKISGNVGTLTIVGGGRTTLLSTANDFIGDILISGSGTILQASVANEGETIPDSCNINVGLGSILQLASANNEAETIAGLNGAGTVRTYPDDPFGSLLIVGAGDANGNFSGKMLDGENALGLTKIGTGTQILAGDNLNTGDIVVSNGTLQLDGTLASPLTSVEPAGVLSGSGQSSGSINLQGTLDPTGTITTGQSLTLAPDSVILWDLQSWDEDAENLNDLIVADSLTVGSTSQSPVVIRIRASDSTGFSESNRQFTLIETTSGISNFNADAFIIDASEWPLPQGTWQVDTAGNQLVLSYQRLNLAPEFSTSTIQLSLVQDTPIIGSLASYVSDPDTGDALSISKLSGPDWLEIAANGTLTGTPTSGDIGTNLFSIRVTDIGGLTADADLEIEVAALLKDQNNNGIIDSWEIDRFGGVIAAGSNPANADPDGDGLPNLIEFALDTDPLVANSSPMVFNMVDVDGSYHLQLSMTKNALATNLSFQIETAEDLAGPWSSDPTTAVEIIQDNESVLTVRDRASTESAGRRFMRLRVQVSP
ncbi:MAG: cadherin domain-containing protein [Luteolibacter sp.]